MEILSHREVTFNEIGQFFIDSDRDILVASSLCGACYGVTGCLRGERYTTVITMQPIDVDIKFNKGEQIGLHNIAFYQYYIVNDALVVKTHDFMECIILSGEHVGYPIYLDDESEIYLATDLTLELK